MQRLTRQPQTALLNQARCLQLPIEQPEAERTKRKEHAQRGAPRSSEDQVYRVQRSQIMLPLSHTDQWGKEGEVENL
ncbi:hypothetical protein MHYP_G00339310 [Metynnis hypsauchen]